MINNFKNTTSREEYKYGPTILDFNFPEFVQVSKDAVLKYAAEEDKNRLKANIIGIKDGAWLEAKIIGKQRVDGEKYIVYIIDDCLHHEAAVILLPKYVRKDIHATTFDTFKKDDEVEVMYRNNIHVNILIWLKAKVKEIKRNDYYNVLLIEGMNGHPNGTNEKFYPFKLRKPIMY